MHNFDAVLVPDGDLRLARLAQIEAGLQFDDSVNIQFTSGTTGAPKGATLTHHNILNNGFFVGEAMRLTSRDRLCIPGAAVPLLRHGAREPRLRDTHGAAMVFPGESFEPKAC
jgi:fatty-acyl-CoA synthase